MPQMAILNGMWVLGEMSVNCRDPQSRRWNARAMEVGHKAQGEQQA
jgi:hypothetical protein